MTRAAAVVADAVEPFWPEIEGVTDDRIRAWLGYVAAGVAIRAAAGRAGLSWQTVARYLVESEPVSAALLRAQGAAAHAYADRAGGVLSRAAAEIGPESKGWAQIVKARSDHYWRLAGAANSQYSTRQRVENSGTQRIEVVEVPYSRPEGPSDGD